MADPQVVIISGAGASTALGLAEPLPMMEEWCRRIVAALEAAERGMAQAVGLKDGMGGEAFERALGQFLLWQRNLGLLDRFSQLGSPQVDQNMGPFNDWLNRAKARAPRVIQTITASLWREFGIDRIDAEGATAAYSRLATAVGATGKGGTRIFSATTNYDRSGEIGWIGAGFEPDDGGRHETYGGSRYLRVEQVVPWADHGTVPHLHLHGAVGWYRRPRSGILIEPGDREYDDRLVPAVLYPDPNKDPYAESDLGVNAVWRVFDQALAEASHVLILGHSLHDKPLLQALESRVATTRPVRLAVTYFGGEGAAKLLIEQMSGTALASDTLDLSLIEVDFGANADLGLIRRWMEGRTLGPGERPHPSAGRAAGEIARPGRPLDITAFEVLRGDVLPVDDTDIGPAMGIRHTDQGDGLAVLRTPPSSDFLLECDVHLLPGGLLNILFDFDSEHWSGFMARVDSRPYPPEGDRFLVVENGKTGVWRDAVMGQVNSPANEWFPVALRVDQASATLYRQGGLVCQIGTHGPPGTIGFFTELQTAHIANVRLTEF